MVPDEGATPTGLPDEPTELPEQPERVVVDSGGRYPASSLGPGPAKDVEQTCSELWATPPSYTFGDAPAPPSVPTQACPRLLGGAFSKSRGEGAIAIAQAMKRPSAAGNLLDKFKAMASGAGHYPLEKDTLFVVSLSA